MTKKKSTNIYITDEANSIVKKIYMDHLKDKKETSYSKIIEDAIHHYWSQYQCLKRLVSNESRDSNKAE